MKASMKPLTNWSWRKPFFLGLSALAILMSTVACSKNESSPPPPPPPIPPVIPGPVIPSCNGCPANVNAFLASGVGKVMGGSEMEINAEFFGDSSIANSANYQQGYYSLYQNYYGSFAGQAALFIGTNMAYCQVPAGVYTLRTMQPGVWGADGAGRSLQGIYLEATGGPTPIQVYIDAWIDPAVPAVRGRDGRQYPFKVVGTIQVKRTDQPAYVFCQRIME